MFYDLKNLLVFIQRICGTGVRTHGYEIVCIFQGLFLYYLFLRARSSGIICLKIAHGHLTLQWNMKI